MSPRIVDNLERCYILDVINTYHFENVRTWFKFDTNMFLSFISTSNKITKKTQFVMNTLDIYKIRNANNEIMYQTNNCSIARTWCH